MFSYVSFMCYFYIGAFKYVDFLFHVRNMWTWPLCLVFLHYFSDLNGVLYRHCLISILINYLFCILFVVVFYCVHFHVPFILLHSVYFKPIDYVIDCCHFMLYGVVSSGVYYCTVALAFQYILYIRSFYIFCIVMSRKFISFCSFCIVNSNFG
jgi:hypothetical protein